MQATVRPAPGKSYLADVTFATITLVAGAYLPRRVRQLNMLRPDGPLVVSYGGGVAKLADAGNLLERSRAKIRALRALVARA